MSRNQDRNSHLHRFHTAVIATLTMVVAAVAIGMATRFVSTTISLAPPPPKLT